MVDGQPVTKNFVMAPTPQLLLDANELAKGKAYSEVSAASHSPDHTLFAYAEDAQGSEVHKIYVKDLATGEVLPEVIDSATGDFVFSPDSQWIFWTNRDDNGRPDKIFRRPARGGKTTLVYEEADDGMFIGVGRTADDQFIVIGIQNQETSEARYIPAASPTAEPVVLEQRVVATRYDVDHWGDRWVIRTNADDAIDFKIVQAPTATPAKANWTDLVPHTPGRFIEGLDLTNDHLARQERADANTRIIIRDRTGAEHEIAVDEPAFALSLAGASEYETTTTRYTYNSPSTPTQTFDYDMASRERTLRKTQQIPSGHNIEDYVVERLNALGIRRPVGAGDGPAPQIDARRWIGAAAALRVRLLRHPHACQLRYQPAIAGGSRLDLRHRPHSRRIRQGLGLVPRRAEDDEEEHLHRLHRFRRTPDRQEVRHGRKHCGSRRIWRWVCLMGAVNNMRPDLWAGIIGQVPFVDVINTMSDTSLPLTPPEWPEWGNPIEDPAAYDYMMSYSPYDQVEPKAYPAVLATGGLSDPRVTYWEPEKWVAKLRPATTSGKPVLLKINMEAGHGGAAGRFDYLKEVAHDYAFAVWAIDKGWEPA
jgi:oligopeptidase B